MGLIRGHYVLLSQNTGFIMHFYLSVFDLGNSSSHFLEMTMLISKIGRYPDSRKEEAELQK